MKFPQPPIHEAPIAGVLSWVHWFSQVASYFKEPIIKSLDSTTLSTNWSNAGGAYQTGRYYIDANGIVHLEGSIKKSIAGVAGETIFTLAVGYRPSAQLSFAVDANSAYGRIDVKADGTVTYQAGAATVSMSLNGISFKGA